MTDPGWTWPDSKIIRVIDGDTIDALLTRDLGFGGAASFTVRLRLNRINAPALHTTAGTAALVTLKAILGSKETVGGIQIDTLKPYKYGGPDNSPGEWMAEIHLGSGLASDLMVELGRAVYWNGGGPRPADGTQGDAA